MEDKKDGNIEKWKDGKILEDIFNFELGMLNYELVEDEKDGKFKM